MRNRLMVASAIATRAHPDIAGATVTTNQVSYAFGPADDDGVRSLCLSDLMGNLEGPGWSIGSNVVLVEIPPDHIATAFLGTNLGNSGG